MKDLWQEITQTIRRNKWRSVMTAFGVFWGILMLILLMGCGFGLENGLMTNLKGVPTNTFILGNGRTTIAYKGFRKDRYWTMDTDDVAAIGQQLEGRARYISSVNFAGTHTISHGTQADDYSVAGITTAYYYSTPQRILFGRYINELDLHERRKVCVIGQKVHETLFPDGADPCGQLIKAGSIYYTIIGVVKTSTEMTIGVNINEAVLLPLSTEQLAYHQRNTIDMLIVTLHDEYDLAEPMAAVERTVKERHLIHPDDSGAIWSFNMAEVFGTFKALFLGINILIWIVGAGTLLAGLIGISNIMLVTVKERTQEIGIRRALGAKPRAILTQVMAESLLLTAAAGIVGLMFGIWALAAVSPYIPDPATSDSIFAPPQVPFDLAIAALVILVVGGLAAGWLPAQRAMKIKAIEALREE